jgi:hypothetical protein
VVVHGPAVCEHCIASAQLQAGRKPKQAPLSEPEQAALFKAVKEWEAWLDACEASAPEGFIAAKGTGGPISSLEETAHCSATLGILISRPAQWQSRDACQAVVPDSIPSHEHC